MRVLLSRGGAERSLISRVFFFARLRALSVQRCNRDSFHVYIYLRLWRLSRKKKEMNESISANIANPTTFYETFVLVVIKIRSGQSFFPIIGYFTEKI